MAQAKIVQTVGCFDLNIQNISKIENFWSPQVMIQGIPWIFNIKKKYVDSEECLAIYLRCKKEDTAHDWAIVASSTIQLIPFRGKVMKTIEYRFPPYFFDYKERGCGVSIIRLKDLFDIKKNYVKDDAINLNIKIETVNPNQENASKLLVDFNKCCDESSQGTLRLTVNNIDSLMAVRTSEFVLQNLRWDLTVFQSSISGLGLSVCCKDEHHQSCLVTVNFEMKSSIDGVQDVEKTQSQQFQSYQNFNVASIISWTELFKPENGFVVDNSVSFEVKIKVNKWEEVAPNTKKRRLSNPPEAELDILTLECAICLDKIKDQNLSSTDCGHLFCTVCITNAVEAHGRCSTCNLELTMDKLRRLYLPIAKRD